MVTKCSNTLAWLRHREFGATDSAERRGILLQRLSKLSLDGDARLQSQAAGGITCLTVDSAEQRYALASAQDGSVQCFDILGTVRCPSSLPTWAVAQSKETPENPVFKVSPLSRGVRSNGGHSASATAVAWFPKDNGAFVSCSKDMTAKLWDPNIASLVASFSTIAPANTLAMSPQQPLAAVACDDSCIRLLDITAGVATHTLMGYSSGVMSVAWCGASEHQVAGGDAGGELRLFDIRRAGTLHSFDMSEASTGSACDHSTAAVDTNRGSYVAPGGHDILATTPVATRAHDGAITGLTQTPDARWWVSSGTDNAVRVWSVERRTNSLLRFPGALNSARSARQIVVDPSSQVLFFPSGSVVSTYSLSTGAKLSDLRGHHATINAAAWSSRQASLLTGSTDKQLLLWSPGAAPQDSTNVCVGGDRIEGEVDKDAWSDDDAIVAAARSGPAWEGGAAGVLRGLFSGGRNVSGAARNLLGSPLESPPVTAVREPDGNAAHGVGEEDGGGAAAASGPPQRLQAVSEAALAHRAARASGGKHGRPGAAQRGTLGSAPGVLKPRKADGASQRIKRIAHTLIQRLSSHMPDTHTHDSSQARGPSRESDGGRPK